MMYQQTVNLVFEIKYIQAQIIKPPNFVLLVLHTK